MSEDFEIKVRGMHCVNCAQGLEKALKKLGLQDVAVDLASASASFSLDDRARLPEIVKTVEGLGYQVITEGAPTGLSRRLTSPEAQFLFCLIFTLPLLLHMLMPHSLLHLPKVQLALCLPVFLVGLAHFGRSALASLRAGLPNMDVLIVIGITASFAYSLTGTLLNLGADYLFYETAASITTIVLLGNLLEQRSVRKTTSAVEDLSRLQIVKARLIANENNREVIREVDSRQIHIEDVFLVNSGDRVPTDGEVIWGSALVDEAVITGESLPAQKEPGSRVVGGTTVIGGSIRVKALAVGEKTVVAEMVRLVKKAQADPPRIQRIGDRVSAVFVPVVLAIAALTFGVSFFALDVGFQAALLRAVAVLVVACPCAMGLATPTAVMVGIGQAAQKGILVKGGATLEKLAQVKTVIFDKTGTLTTGKFKLKFIDAPLSDRSRVESILLALERHSSHPIAKSLTAALQHAAPFDLRDVEEQRGRGIRAKDAAGDEYELAAGDGGDLALRQNGKAIARIEIEDELKPDALAAIIVLKQQGLTTALLSGDSRRKCEAAARLLGIESVFAEKTPAEKVQTIDQLEAAQPSVFVGDGINDAPALARATVGMALSDAAQIAVQSAQVVVLGSELRHIANAVSIARLTLRTIKQNLFWAFLYNVLAIPAAAAGYLNPALAAAAMAFSDVIVIGNSLRMKRRVPTGEFASNESLGR